MELGSRKRAPANWRLACLQKFSIDKENGHEYNFKHAEEQPEINQLVS